MKIEVYGNKLAKEKIEKILAEKMREVSKFVSNVNVYLGNFPRKCLECQYFPTCEEKCNKT